MIRPEPSSQRCTSPQVRAEASERLSPASESTARTSAVRAPDWRWGLASRRPHPFGGARTPGSRQGDSSFAHSCAFEMADVASRMMAMLAPEFARAAR